MVQAIYLSFDPRECNSRDVIHANFPFVKQKDNTFPIESSFPLDMNVPKGPTLFSEDYLLKALDWGKK